MSFQINSIKLINYKFIHEKSMNLFTEKLNTTGNNYVFIDKTDKLQNDCIQIRSLKILAQICSKKFKKNYKQNKTPKKKTNEACTNCRIKHIRCSGVLNCHNCKKSGLNCKYTPKIKKYRKSSKIY